MSKAPGLPVTSMCAKVLFIHFVLWKALFFAEGCYVNGYFQKCKYTNMKFPLLGTKKIQRLLHLHLKSIYSCIGFANQNVARHYEKVNFGIIRLLVLSKSNRQQHCT